MKYKGAEIYSLMESMLGNRGAQARAYCHLGAGQPWCNAQVTYAFYKEDAKKLFCNGRKETYCPHSIQWCYANLADIPIYLALEGDIIYFDWERNGTPNHIGFVRNRVSDVQIDTVEGNTSGGKVANKTREGKYVQAVFRPHYPVPKSEYDISKPLKIDGQFGFNSIACLQMALGIEADAILDKRTVKALQKRVGVTADGSWGTKTTKAVQKMVGVKVDGFCGAKTVKGLQKWINTQNEPKKPEKKPEKKEDPLKKWYDAMTTQFNWSRHQKYKWVTPTVKSSREKGTCITFVAVSLQRLGLLRSGEYFYFDPKTKKIAGNAAKYVETHNGIFELSYPNKTIKALGDKIKKGDIIGFGNPYYHTMVYMGRNKKGTPIFNTMGGGKRGLKVAYPLYAKRKVNMIVRLKKTER